MNYQTHYKKITEALNQFEAEIGYLQQDLDQYKKQKPVERVVYYKTKQIQVLAALHGAIVAYKEETDQLFLKLEKQLAKKNDTIFKFEGICLLHGIIDIEFYLSKTSDQIGRLVQQAYAEKWRQTPLQLLPGYTLIEDIRLAPAPVVDFKTLLSMVEHSSVAQKYNTEKQIGK